MATCARCAKTGEKLKVEDCVACGASCCVDCLGPEGDDYKELGGKKGVACRECVVAGIVYESGPLARGSEIYARIQGRLLPDAAKAIDARLDYALERMEKLTKGTLSEAEGTVERLVGRLETAIATQRSGARTDVDFVLKNIKGTVIWAAVILALINLAGIAAAVLAANALR